MNDVEDVRMLLLKQHIWTKTRPRDKINKVSVASTCLVNSFVVFLRGDCTSHLTHASAGEQSYFACSWCSHYIFNVSNGWYL